jgi:hypothetical protein
MLLLRPLNYFDIVFQHILFLIFIFHSTFSLMVLYMNLRMLDHHVVEAMDTSGITMNPSFDSF